MALNKAILIYELTAAFSIDSVGKDNKREVIRKIADAIEKYVQSGQVTGTCPTGAISGRIL